MTLQDNVTLLDQFTFTLQDAEKILLFDFISSTSTPKEEKVKLEQTFCTLVAVGGKYLERETFTNVLKKIDEIREIIRKKFTPFGI